MQNELPPLIKLRLENYCGIDYELIGKGSIASLIKKRQIECSLPSDEAYFDFLSKNNNEFNAFVEGLLIPETWFFRDSNPFLYLSDFSKKFEINKTFLRILSIPCATGEETYSIAMTLINTGWSTNSFSVHGVDLGQKFIEIAQKGIYSKKSFHSKDYCEKSKYFDQIDDNFFSIKKSVQDPVHFMHGNIIDPKLLNSSPLFHAIFARNILIYLSLDARKKALANIDRLLLPNGRLFLGHADDISLLSDKFKPTGPPSAFVFEKSLPTKQNFTFIQNKPNLKKRASKDPIPTAIPPPINTNSELLEQAQQLANQGLFQQAKEFCNKHIKIHGPSAEPYFLIGQIFAAQNKLDSAEEAYKKAIYLNNKHVNALFQLELLYIGKNNLKQAKILHDRLIRLKNDNLNSA